jgi:hypothetical protein
MENKGLKSQTLHTHARNFEVLLCRKQKMVGWSLAGAKMKKALLWHVSMVNVQKKNMIIFRIITVINQLQNILTTNN